MKNLLRYLFVLCIVLLSNGSQAGQPDKYSGGPDTLKVFVAPGQKELMENIVSSYYASGGSAIINLQDPAKLVGTKGNYLQVKSDPACSNSNPGNWSLTIGREILVPVVGNNSPERSKILGKGLLHSELKAMIESSQVLDAGQLGRSLYSSNEIVFCRLSDLVKEGSGELLTGIELVPFDVNKNGQIDGFEDSYKTYSDINRSVWLGKYPRVLFNEIRVLSDSKPVDKASVDFMEWLVTEGQTAIYEAGISDLINYERSTALARINTPVLPDKVVANVSAKAYAPFIWLIAGLLIVITAGFVSLFFIRVPLVEPLLPPGGEDLRKDLINMPEGLMYDNAYTWAYMEREGTVRVGITDLLRHFTGKISKLKLRNEGEMIKKGDLLFTLIQDGKHLEIVSPVTGTIRKINTVLEGDAADLNSNPYDKGWIYELIPEKWMTEARSFNLGYQFRGLVENEITRLKDFVEKMQVKGKSGIVLPVMQEGGQIKDGFLEQMSPEFWEEFQNEFINRA